MEVTSTTPVSLVNAVYARLPERVAIGRERLSRPLTFAEKVLVNHLHDAQGQALEREEAMPTSIPTGSPCKMPSLRSSRFSS